MQEMFLSDNSGNRVAHPKTADPVAGSGISVALTTAGSDYTGTVVGGQSYIVSANGGFCLLSATGLTSTAANIEWTVNDGDIIIIHVPFGKVTLYCESDTNSTTLYLRKLAP